MGTNKLKELKNFSYYLRGRTRQRYADEHGSKELDKPYLDSGLVLHGQDQKGNLILRKNHRNGDPALARYFELPAGVSIEGGKAVVEKEEPVELVVFSELSLDPKLFVPMKSGTSLDMCFSAEGGLYPGTNYVVLGDPGIGKSTLVMEYGSAINATGKKVLRIEAEMTRIDMHGYVQRFPAFGDISTLFMADYADRDPRKVLADTIGMGWDLVLIDSAAELVADLKEAGMSQGTAEKFIIDLMVQNNQGHNKGKRYTTFLVVQQVNKGGNFVGSNKWKHNTTGMLELRFDRTERVVNVVKNRRGMAYEQMYFVLEGDKVVFREDLAVAAKEAARSKRETEQKLAETSSSFLELFKPNGKTSNDE